MLEILDCYGLWYGNMMEWVEMWICYLYLDNVNICWNVLDIVLICVNDV
jgi:hypothetical protein